MKSENVKKTVLAAMFVSMGIVLPFFTGQLKEVGKMLLPMHLPVLMCGFVLGRRYGFFTGAITPILRSAVFGMPRMFPNALAMAAELAIYGYVSGLLYGRFKKKSLKAVYITLFLAMISGRIVWGLAEIMLLGAEGGFTFLAFVSGAFFAAAPGIALQIVLIPIAVVFVEKINGKM